MPTKTSISPVRLTEFATALLDQCEIIPRARLTADRVAEVIPGSAVVVYVIPDQERPVWIPKASAGEIALGAEKVEFDSGTLGAIADNRSIVLFAGSELSREDFAHLDVRRTVNSLAYIPFVVDEILYGTVEIISYDQTPTEAMVESVTEVIGVAGPAIRSALGYEAERNTNLQSVMRVTQMYDLEKVFNSNLELDELLTTIANKFQEVMNVQGVNVWMVDGDAVKLIRRAGEDPTVDLNTLQKPGDGIAGDVSDNGELVLISDPEDERLRKRNGQLEDGAVFSLLAAALMDRESLVGVVELVNRMDGLAFDEDDEFQLMNIGETASNALHNASLLLAERKVEILETLVKVSGEITSTLNLDRVLQAVVNHTQAIIPFERAAIALEQRGMLHLKAVSGMTQIVPADPAISELREMLEWASISNEEMNVSQRGDQVDHPRPETQVKFAAYFDNTGMRSFYALPLLDDQGRLGMLSFESSDPDFLTVAHLEIIKVLASQATVALRNASLYREVPFINLLEPLLQRKKRFLAMEKRRRGLLFAATAAAVLFLIFCPLPMRVSGSATVASARTAQVQAAVDGVVRNVYVRESDRVKQGAVLAELEDWNYRADLTAAEAKYNESLAAMNRALAQNDGSLAGTERLKVDYYRAELSRARERLERATIRAPFDGVVTTQQVEDSVGRRLQHGDTFAEMMMTSNVTVDVAIPEEDATLVRGGDRASVKLESFPLQTFRGGVAVVSPQSQVASDQRYFMARVDVPNEQGAIRPGMQGHAKVSVGWHPAGYVWFRGSAMWVWGKLWSWFGW